MLDGPDCTGLEEDCAPIVELDTAKLVELDGRALDAGYGVVELGVVKLED